MLATRPSQKNSTMIRSTSWALSACLLLSLIGCGGGGGTSLTSADESPDPVVLDIPIAYIKRPTPTADEEGQVSIANLSDPIEIFPGARLFIRARASNLAEETEISDQIIAIIAAETMADPDLLGLDIKDLETSFDGQTLIFAARGIPDIENNNEPELYTWNIWTYDFKSGVAGYLIPSALIRNEGAEFGGGHDMAPHFLTDDRIVFSSSRQSAIQEKQLNEGRGQRYSAVSEFNANVQAVALHTYDPDSGTISQISLNRSMDLDPATLASGEIIFSRLNTNRQISLYQINPSGAQVSALYGRDSGDLVAAEESVESNSNRIHFLQPREMPDGRILTFIRPDNQTQLGGDFVVIDTAGFLELFTTVNNSQGGTQRAHSSLTDLEVNALDDLSPGGKFLAAYPLKDGSERILVSWSPCRIEDQEGLIKPCSIADDDDRVMLNSSLQLQAAPSTFGLWVYDPAKNTQLPVVLAEQGFVISEVVAAESDSYPSSPDESDIFDANLALENQGLLIINSVYNEDGGLVNYAQNSIAAYAEPGTLAYSNRPARFLRVIQPVPMPNDDVLNNLPGDGAAFDLLEILGYAPVEPDGSVSVKVPANTPLLISIVNADGRRISRRHDHWLQVAQGEVLHCVGCHDPNSDVPHGRLDSQPPTMNPGAISLNTGLEGFIAADPTLFASALGDTMAEVYNLRKPDLDPTVHVRELQLELTYSDEWTDTNLFAADSDIDLSYDPNWNIPAANAIIAPNLDTELQGRIVINYNDHIQLIWERVRVIEIDNNPVFNQRDEPVSNCIGCHSNHEGNNVPAGQLDLTDSVDGAFTVSYRELTRRDNEQWITDPPANAVADRVRVCDFINEQGLPDQREELFPVRASINRRSANASGTFFNCFEVDDSPNCGAFLQDLSPPPAGCSDAGGTAIEDNALTTKVVPDDLPLADGFMNALDPMDPTLSLQDNPQLMFLLNTNCESCHSTGGGQTAHSDNDTDIAYAAMKSFVNLVNPSSSELVTRLTVRRHGPTGNHSCADSNACDLLGAAIEQAITIFSTAVPAEEIDNVIPGGSVSEQGTFNHFNLLTPSELRLISE